MLAGAAEGDVRVRVRSSRCGVLAVLAVAVGLAGCGGTNFDTSGSWFSKPLDVFGRNAGYTYSQLDQSKQERPITANDLVDANGACPPAAAPAGATAPPDSLLGGGIGIGMSECDVIARVGPPAEVNLGRNPNGDRTAILTFKGGARPGVYRFVAGRLKEMDRVEVPPPPPQPVKKKTEKKIAKKPPAKTEKPPKIDGKT